MTTITPSTSRRFGSPTDKQAVGTSRIVIFGDDGPEANELEKLIEDTWEIPVIILRDSPEDISAFHDIHPDLVVMDHKEAAHVLQEIRQDVNSDGFLPTLVLISDEERDEKQGDVVAGATEFLTKPIDPAEALLRIHNLLSLHEAWHQLHDRISSTEQVLRKRTDSLREQLVRLHGREQTLVQQNRLRALGTMASGVAHDFNNVLSVIIGFTEQLLRDEQHLPFEKRRDLLKLILTAAEDGAGIVHRIREFHRPTGTKEIRRPIDLNELIEQTVSLTRPKWFTQSRNQGVEVAMCTELAQVPPISGDAAELREMLTNLIFNAVDAMPQGGTIGLHTRFDAGEVVLEVRDTGTGMSDRIRRRCLEPFFSTKGEQGTGLGLAMVHGIVERHEATMELESEVGHGTVFRFRFKSIGLDEGSTIIDARAATDTLNILVVDDEPIIGDLLVMMLARDGHQASAITDPRDALKCVLENAIDLVITDKSMPLMSGDELAVVIKAACPATRVMLVTGYGQHEPTASCVDHVLGKPVDLDTLRQAVAETCSHPVTQKAA